MALEHVRTEEVVKTLAGAANAVRLYPPTSLLPAQAIDRFLVSVAQTLTDGGTVQVTVEPKGFTWSEMPLAEGQSNVVSFAEALYAHQVGKLIVASGPARDEVLTFLRCVAVDPPEVKDAGGLRAVLKKSNVSHLAVIEVTLRASTEEGLAGIDLTTAPLDEIAPRMATAAGTWEETASAGEGVDEVAGAIGSMEQAARELVAHRLGEALLRLDEETRVRAIEAAFATDTAGNPMEGMLDVLARMKPAALARLLTLAAAMSGGTPQGMLAKLKLPPEAMKALAMLLTPASPQAENSMGVPLDIDTGGLAAEVTEEVEAETADLSRQVSRSAPKFAAGRALSTTVEVAAARKTTDAVEAVGDALVPALRAGGFAEVRAALSTLTTLSSEVSLSETATQAKLKIADPDLLAHTLATLPHGIDPDVVGDILRAAGPVGADTVIAAYVASGGAERPQLQQVLRSMGDVVAAAAGRRIRGADSATAIELIDVLTSVGDKRTLPILRQALEHVDFDVRRACLAALAAVGGTEANQLLAGALNHWDPETRSAAAKEIGRAKVQSAVPAMIRILQGYYLFEQNYALKKEVIGSLEAMGSSAAVPTLRRMAGRRFVLGRKNRELRFLARRALAGIEASGADRGESPS